MTKAIELPADIYSSTPPGADEFYAQWASGGHYEFGYRVVAAKLQCADPIAEPLYDLHVMGKHSAALDKHCRLVKDWAYGLVATYAATRPASARISNYRQDWTRQAARDGLFIALWGAVPGMWCKKRAEHFQVSERPYRRVRDLVEGQSKALINDFRFALDQELHSQE